MKTQVWIAVAVYVLVAIVRKRLNLELSLHRMLQILRYHTVRDLCFNSLPTRQPSEDLYDDPNQLILL